MRKIHLTYILGISCLLFNSCSKQKEASITIQSSNAPNDTIQVNQLMTNVSRGEFKATAKNTLNFQVSKAEILTLRIKNKGDVDLIISKPGLHSTVIVDSTGIHGTSKADSLLNYVLVSSNNVIAENSSLIFSGNNHDRILQTYDSLIIARNNLIKEAKLDAEISKLLTYQNKSRAYSFLFYYGRMIHELHYTDDFFRFTTNISTNESYSRTSPLIVLYKFEIDYLKQHQSIESVEDFIGFIESKLKNKDDAQFMKAFYVKQLIESPQYWEKHNKVFNSVALKKIIKKEANNPYSFLYEQGTKSYFNAMKGEEAGDFTALKPDSSQFQLDSLKGKLIIIDAWATWCVSCIKQKPYFTEVANAFKGNDNISFLSVSIDKSFSKWKNYMARKPTEETIIELNVSNALDEFKKAFNVQSIPRYILIAKDGKIIDADMEDPGEGMKAHIEELLE